MKKRIKVIQVNKETGKKKERYYFRSDRESLEGDDGKHLYYFIEEEEKPEYDSNRQYLENSDTLDDKTMICLRSFIKINISNDDIIKRLNNSVGSYLEFEYPLFKRPRHNRQKGDSKTTPERKAYIQSMQDWEDRVLDERDKRESDLMNNSIFPSFVWEKKPEK